MAARATCSTAARAKDTSPARCAGRERIPLASGCWGAMTDGHGGSGGRTRRPGGRGHGSRGSEAPMRAGVLSVHKHACGGRLGGGRRSGCGGNGVVGQLRGREVRAPRRHLHHASRRTRRPSASRYRRTSGEQEAPLARGACASRGGRKRLASMQPVGGAKGPPSPNRMCIWHVFYGRPLLWSYLGLASSAPRAFLLLQRSAVPPLSGRFYLRRAGEGGLKVHHRKFGLGGVPL